MTFRKVLFWVHLVAGVISGLAIAIMCVTGTVLAFEKEITAWSERDARRVELPAPGAPRLSLDELQRRLREAQPSAKPVNVVVQNDPQAAVTFSVGRSGGHYVNPYTGEVRQPQSTAVGTFMREMVEWHRYLNFTGDVSRPRGKWINGVCNLAFCLLAITGLYLWMPRRWSWRALRPIVWFRQNATGKARDFNWHNAIGFWTAPVLIVLTLTAVPISFRWGGDLIHTLTGSPLPVAGASGARGGAATTAPGPDIPVPPPGAPVLKPDAILAAVLQHMPDWKTLTLRLDDSGGGSRPASSSTSVPTANPVVRPGETRARVQPIAVTVRERASWPRTATTTLLLNPYNAEILRQTGYAEMNAAQQVRSWTRFLHTGEALGWMGQLVAGIACLGGVFLVYTGFALSWRRFFGPRANGRDAAADKTPQASTMADSRL